MKRFLTSLAAASPFGMAVAAPAQPVEMEFASETLAGVAASDASPNVIRWEEGSITGCSSNAAATRGYGKGYLTLTAPGAGPTWLSGYKSGWHEEHATVFKQGHWSAHASIVLDQGETYPYCR